MRHIGWASGARHREESTGQSGGETPSEVEEQVRNFAKLSSERLNATGKVHLCSIVIVPVADVAHLTADVTPHESVMMHFNLQLLRVTNVCRPHGEIGVSRAVLKLVVGGEVQNNSDIITLFLLLIFVTDSRTCSRGKATKSLPPHEPLQQNETICAGRRTGWMEWVSLPDAAGGIYNTWVGVAYAHGVIRCASMDERNLVVKG